MEFIPYKANECFEHLYYQIPMELFFNPKYKGKIEHDKNLIQLIRKNYESRIVKSTTHDTENLRPNYNNNNYNNIGKRKNSFFNYEQRHYDNLDFLYANNSF